VIPRKGARGFGARARCIRTNFVGQCHATALHDTFQLV
jgi:hypothetical protein